MKNMFLCLTIAASAFVSLNAFAEGGPIMEPGRVQELSEQTVLMSQVLLNRNLQQCVNEIQQTGYDFSIAKITSQLLTPTSTKYQVIGLALQGTDILAGDIILTIFETVATGAFGMSVKSYTCTVSIQTY